MKILELTYKKSGQKKYFTSIKKMLEIEKIKLSYNYIKTVGIKKNNTPYTNDEIIIVSVPVNV
jgi:hypothetical protein